MIAKKYDYCCEDLSKIENYEKAKADKDNMWCIHHRLETHYEDGTPRKDGDFLSIEDLKERNLYFNRPASELIFLTEENHKKLHIRNICYRKGEENPQYGKSLSKNTKSKISESLKGHDISDETRQKLRLMNIGKKASEETKKKMSLAQSGENNGFYGKSHSEETRKKISEHRKGIATFTGKTHSDNAKNKMSMSKKGRHWFNNGIVSVMTYECPEGFVSGRIM